MFKKSLIVVSMLMMGAVASAAPMGSSGMGAMPTMDLHLSALPSLVQGGVVVDLGFKLSDSIGLGPKLGYAGALAIGARMDIGLGSNAYQTGWKLWPEFLYTMASGAGATASAFGGDVLAGYQYNFDSGFNLNGGLGLGLVSLSASGGGVSVSATGIGVAYEIGLGYAF